MWSSLDYSGGYSLRPCESKGSNCTREMAGVPSMSSAVLGHNVDTRFSSRRTRLYLHSRTELPLSPVCVGGPFGGKGTSRDTLAFAEVWALLSPSGPKPFYPGHYVPKDTVII